MPVFHAYVDSHPATPQEPSCRPRRASTPLWSTSIFHHLGKVSLCSVEIGKLWCSKVGHACRGLKAPGNDKGIDVVHNFAWFLLDVSQRQDLRDMLIRDLSPSLSSSSRSSVWRRDGLLLATPNALYGDAGAGARVLAIRHSPEVQALRAAYLVTSARFKTDRIIVQAQKRHRKTPKAKAADVSLMSAAKASMMSSCMSERKPYSVDAAGGVRALGPTDRSPNAVAIRSLCSAMHAAYADAWTKADDGSIVYKPGAAYQPPMWKAHVAKQTLDNDGDDDVVAQEEQEEFTTPRIDNDLDDVAQAAEDLTNRRE